RRSSPSLAHHRHRQRHAMIIRFTLFTQGSRRRPDGHSVHDGGRDERRYLLSAFLALLAAGSTFSVSAAPTTPQTFRDATPLEWSKRMADSEMARRGDSMFYQGAPRARWD